MSSRTDNELASLHPSHNRALEPRFIANVDGGLLSKSNLLKFIRAFFQVSGIDEGYYLEFGVFNGQSAIEAYGVLRGIATRIYGFDSFAGLPGLSDADARSLKLTPSFAAGNFRSLPVEVVRQYILASATRLAPENLVLTEGYFSETLPVFDKRQLRDKGPCLVAHIDCDLYSSSADVFAFLDDVVSEGTWLLLDDYWAYRGSPRHGQRRAFEEWLSRSKRFGATEYASYNGFCRAFVVYEKG